mmetsp:Transcript_31926/g.98850  ORF Transcript_31926/g.98850 Transcript_31926/m.98850 type:complete len:272 (+) Transcript_31926:840-1655(+)
MQCERSRVCVRRTRGLPKFFQHGGVIAHRRTVGVESELEKRVESRKARCRCHAVSEERVAEDIEVASAREAFALLLIGMKNQRDDTDGDHTQQFRVVGLPVDQHHALLKAAHLHQHLEHGRTRFRNLVHHPKQLAFDQGCRRSHAAVRELRVAGVHVARRDVFARGDDEAKSRLELRRLTNNLFNGMGKFGHVGVLDVHAEVQQAADPHVLVEECCVCGLVKVLAHFPERRAPRFDAGRQDQVEQQPQGCCGHGMLAETLGATGHHEREEC